ncbi:MAG: AAA family ATPase, partial [Anaerolineae bacterium]|nr:AAA family ATPase [Anaerolineae bacterium]
METITGVIERITFQNEETGYTVAKVAPDEDFPDAQARDGTIAVVGIMPQIGLGENVEFTGSWYKDPRYGLQFRAEIALPIPPTSIPGIIAYLSNGTIKGIGPRTAERIVAHFGENTLTILDEDPQRIRDVPGLKLKLIENIIENWSESTLERSMLVWLAGKGVSTKMAKRIFKEYGGETRQIVVNNPYQLYKDVEGIGFVRADAIARGFEIGVEDPRRLLAGLYFTLEQLAMEGHTYATRQFLLDKAVGILKFDHVLQLEIVLDQELRRVALGSGYEGLIVESFDQGDDLPPIEHVYLPQYHKAETRAAEYLKRMVSFPSVLAKTWKKVDWEAYLKRLAEKNNVALTEQQQSAVRAALTTKVSILTGGPGTGKTTTLQMVINALIAEKRSFKLASPTGRAAKRLSEATGQPASTIHRMLGYVQGEGATHDEDNPLNADMIIIDETSMLDLQLFSQLVRAIRPDSHLLLVGDVDQLPSVGAGNVLRDIIDSEIAYVTRLKTIFRQSEDSLIIVNAHRVNQGEMPLLDNRSTDFFFFGEEDPQAAAELVVDIVNSRLPRKFGVHPVDDVQVIAPMYRTPIGVDALNTALQQALNGSDSVMSRR